jgi:hypothetical protein
MGGGVFLWAVGVLLAYREAWIFRLHEESILLVALFLAVSLAMARGYPTPVRSFVGLAGRLAGAIAGGALTCLAVAASLTPIMDRTRHGDRPAAVAAAGAIAALLGVAWIHGRALRDRFRASIRARWLAGAAAAVLFAISVWPMSDRLRCALGSGDACVSSAKVELDGGREEVGLSLAARGCALASAESCALAGDASFWGFGGSAQAPRDLRGAEPFYRESCALGDEEGCHKLHVVELHGRCQRQSASACRELADVYRSGEVTRDAAAAARFLQQACLLGEPQACQGGR